MRVGVRNGDFAIRGVKRGGEVGFPTWKREWLKIVGRTFKKRFEGAKSDRWKRTTWG